jgi:putative transposase
MIEYLCELRRLHGGSLVVVCDRLSVHRSAVRQLRERGAPWLDVEWLPAYAPDLNPVEALWSHAKYTALANFIPNDVDHLFDAVADTINDVHYEPRLLNGFFQAAKLRL